MESRLILNRHTIHPILDVERGPTDPQKGRLLKYAHETLKEARYRAVPIADFNCAGSLGISTRSSGDDLSPATPEADPRLSRGFGLAFRHRRDRSLESGRNQAAVSAGVHPSCSSDGRSAEMIAARCHAKEKSRATRLSSCSSTSVDAYAMVARIPALFSAAIASDRCAASIRTAAGTTRKQRTAWRREGDLNSRHLSHSMEGIRPEIDALSASQKASVLRRIY
jgi:hypothetical protein